MSNFKKTTGNVKESSKAVTKESASPAPAKSAVSPAPAGAGTLEPTMKERIVAALQTAAKNQTLRWWELTHICGIKALGEMDIQLSPTGIRDHNVKVWYGVSKAFHDAIQELRDENRIRLLAVSPIGYFPAAQTPPMPIAHDYKIAYPSPRLFLTNVELLP